MRLHKKKKTYCLSPHVFCSLQKSLRLLRSLLGRFDAWLESSCLPACLFVLEDWLVGFFWKVFGFFWMILFGIDCSFGFSVCVSLVGDLFSCCVFVCLFVFWGRHLGNKAAPREKLPIFIQWNCSCYAIT